MIETLELRSRDEIHDDGRSSFTWNDVMFESFNAGNLKRIDLGVYFNLKLAAAKQMYRFLDKRFYKKACLEFDLREFATEHIGLGRRYDNHGLKRKLLPALKELEDIGFITPCKAEERFRCTSPGKWIIALQKGTGALAQQDSKIVKELTSRGVNRKVARELGSQFPEELIEAKIRLHDSLVSAKDKRISRNPAGFLTAAIRHDYPEPPAEKLRRAPQRTSPSAFSPASLELKTAVATKLTDAEKTEQAEFQKHWDGMSIEDRTRLERDALQAAPKFHRETLQRVEKSSPGLLPQLRMKLMREFLLKQNSSKA